MSGALAPAVKRLRNNDRPACRYCRAFACHRLSSASAAERNRIRGGLISDYGSDAGVDVRLDAGDGQFAIIARAMQLDHT